MVASSFLQASYRAPLCPHTPCTPHGPRHVRPALLVALPVSHSHSRRSHARIHHKHTSTRTHTCTRACVQTPSTPTLTGSTRRRSTMRQWHSFHGTYASTLMTLDIRRQEPSNRTTSREDIVGTQATLKPQTRPLPQACPACWTGFRGMKAKHRCVCTTRASRRHSRDSP